jgi:basic membrane protein A and related proteins
MKGGLRLATALVAGLAIIGAACAGDETPSGGGGTGGGATKLPGADIHVCYASDTGGVDDRSFNQAQHEGFLQAKKELGIQYTFVQSTSAADYDPILLNFVNQDCDLIAPAGFAFGPATIKSASENLDQKYMITDYDIFDFSDPNKPKDLIFDNVKEITFKTDEAAFLAGYVAAGMTKTGKVATFGGVLFPTVTIFMNGFSAGVRAYNKDKGTKVQVLGWNPETRTGTQISPDPAVGFDNAAEGRRIAEDFIAEGADIILPVAGPSGLGSLAAAQDAGNVMAIWVDVDGCVSAPEFCDLFLTSVLKNMAFTSFETTKSVVEGTFQAGLYVGTLKNNGVGIADYHNFDSQVPADLKAKVEELKQGIIAGTVSVDPKDYPA